MEHLGRYVHIDRGASRSLGFNRPAREAAMSADKTPYDIDLPRNPANFQPLTPLSFLERAAAVFPDRTAIIHGAGRRG